MFQKTIFQSLLRLAFQSIIGIYFLSQSMISISNAQESTYLLSVYANPIQAKIEVDGRIVCSEVKNDLSPCMIKLSVGKHLLSVTLDGYETKTETFDIQSDISVNWNLKQLFFQLSVISYPIGSVVSIDGEKKGETPILGLQLKPNEKHFIEVEAKCHEIRSEQIIGQSGESKTLQIKLNPIKDCH